MRHKNITYPEELYSNYFRLPLPDLRIFEVMLGKIARYLVYLRELRDITCLGPLSLSKFLIIVTIAPEKLHA